MTRLLKWLLRFCEVVRAYSADEEPRTIVVSHLKATEGNGERFENLRYMQHMAFGAIERLERGQRCKAHEEFQKHYLDNCDEDERTDIMASRRMTVILARAELLAESAHVDEEVPN